MGLIGRDVMIEWIKRMIGRNKTCYQFVYYCFRIYGVLFSILCILMRVFPIKNKIVCCNMKGKRYGDNPKYIADEIIRRGLDYEIVWLLNEKEDEELPTEIRRASHNPFSMAYELATAKVWIDSNTKQYGTLKRKNQIYIQTWHGSYGLKKVYGDIPEKITSIDSDTMQYNSKITDLMISNSRQTTEIYQRAFWYKGNILECGSPRNDIFFVDAGRFREKVQAHFEIVGKKIALYAPTFRKNFATDVFRLDYRRLQQILQKRYSGEWVILIRLHPNNIADAETFIEYKNDIINATDYSVMQELLVASDVLITDYSSCMFDFVTTGKTCFLYATDVEAYREERDYYFDLKELPFPLAQNNDEMEENILNFDEEKYQKELNQLFEKVGLCESGNASGQVVDYIQNWMKGN